MTDNIGLDTLISLLAPFLLKSHEYTPAFEPKPLS